MKTANEYIGKNYDIFFAQVNVELTTGHSLYAIFCQISGKLLKLPSNFSTILVGRKPKRNGLISIAHIFNMIKVSLATLFRVDSSKKVK